MKNYTVIEEDDGSRLDRVIARRMGDIPHSMMQKLLRKKLIRLDGKKAEASTRVKEGQVIELKIEIGTLSPETGQREKKEIVLDAKTIAEVQKWVLHKDKDILVINKPAGLPVQGGSKITKHLDGLLPALQFEAKESPRLVHRLDKDTSGIMLLARNLNAAQELQKAFSGKVLQKKYLALTAGVPDAYNGEIESNLDKISRGEDSREMVKSVDEDGKRAITRYRVIEALAKQLALIELEPITGRTHQLRVHMAELGCPIVGDGKYGGGKSHVKGTINLSPKLHLHAWKIELPALFGRPERTFEAPVPEHMQQSFDALGLELDD
jgi:23S rRNA pseudouridine955/2504/2580 synthase